MRPNDGKGRAATGKTRRRWTALCLFLAVGMLLIFSHTTSVPAYTQAAQLAHTSDGVEPYDSDYATGDEHCHVPSACPLFAPTGAQAAVFVGTSAPRPRHVDQSAEGHVTAPGFHPPRRLLHA